MKFAITQEITDKVRENGISDIINELSIYISTFLNERTYGEGLKTYYIGVICVSHEFDFFFKIRKPKYKKGISIYKKDGREYETVDEFGYDIKLDYEKLINADDLEIRRILITDVSKSLDLIDNIKIKEFDKSRFKKDLLDHLIKF